MIARERDDWSTSIATAVGAYIEYDIAKKKIEPVIFHFELLKKTYNL